MEPIQPIYSIILQTDDVTDHYMVTCKIRTAEICHVAPCYRPGRTIPPTTIDKFSNSLPDQSRLLSKTKQTDELEEMTSSLRTIF